MKNNTCRQATFLLSTLTASIMSVQYGYATMEVPAAGVNVTNTAYASYIDSDKKQLKAQSNTVEVSISVLYAVALTTPPLQEVEAGTRVVWLNTLTNLSNTDAQVLISRLNVPGLSNIKIYIDSNQNGEFDATDLLVTDALRLERLQSVNLWVVADTSASLSDRQILELPLTATVLEDTSVKATAKDSLITYLPKVYATKRVDRDSFTPDVNKSFDLTYTLVIENKSRTAITPTSVLIDGQPSAVVLMTDALPANTVFKSAKPLNSSAKVLYRTGDNSFSSQLPADKTLINELVVAYPQAIAANATEQVQLLVEMNSNIANTTLVNRFHVKHVVGGTEKTTDSNDVSTVVAGKPGISNNTSTYNKVLATGSLNHPLYISANSTQCNASRNVSEQVRIRIKSTKTGDEVIVIGTEVDPVSGKPALNTGVFHYELPTQESTTANPNDQVLQTVKRDNVLVSLINCLDSNGNPTASIKDVDTTVLMDPYGVVFDAKTGQPVKGARVILLDAAGKPIGSNVAFSINRSTGALESMPAEQFTNELGEFIYPLVIAGTYSVQVDTSTIKGPVVYKFTSNKTVYPVSGFGNKQVNDSWSYGGKFTLNEGDPALGIDIPIDPDGTAEPEKAILTVQKAASNSNAEVGDFEDYTVTVLNNSKTAVSTDVKIHDTLPRGFIYVPGTARVDGVKVGDPEGGKGPYLTLGLNNLAPQKQVKVQYRVYIGPNALNGDGTNRVYARDVEGNTSKEAAAVVKVSPGPLISDAFIIGKVFMDCNRNGVQDAGERGVPGIRIYMEDGSFVVTDREGKYDFYGLTAKTHVLKLDRTTLPGSAELVLLDNRQAGDPGSRFADLKRGELHRADFAIADGAGECSQPLIEQIEKRQKEVEQNNINLEQVLRSDLSIDPLNYAVSDVRGQPASGCISVQGTSSNCSVTLTKDQLSELRTLDIDPVKVAKPLDLEAVLESAESNKLAILNLKDGQVLPHDQTTVQVKGVAGASIQLFVNGKQVADDRIGKRAVLPDFQIAGLDFIGVELSVGRNEIEVRQLDMMGNVRDQQKISVVAPDNMSKISLSAPAQEVQANGSDVYQAVIRVTDQNGTLVASRTPVTLESTIGKIQLKDLEPEKPGVQIFVEGGTVVVPISAPTEPGEGTLQVTSGLFNATQPVRFLPNLRPMLAAGIIEGSLSLQHFDPKQLGRASRNDGFEDELNELSSSESGKTSANGRAALFLKGKVKGEYLLTLAYDSDKDKNQRLFRDIRPDEYYPVYGDAAAKGFDAQSTSKLYVRVDKGRSYAMYGDYVTRTENDEGLSLGQYSRSLTGARTALENNRGKITAFAARTNSRQITTEQRAMLITGPYSIGNVNSDAILSNSEKVEVIVRDRNNPGLIISQKTLTRFTDYQVDTFSNSIFLTSTLGSVDENNNPIYLRITIEADEGGPEYTVAGASASVNVTKKVKVGGSYVKSDDPVTQDELSSVNTVVQLNDKTKLIAEFAHSNNTVDPSNSLANIGTSDPLTGEQSGNAMRVELTSQMQNVDVRVYHNQADSGFYNTASPISAGRKESGIKAQTRIDKVGLLRVEAIRTEDQGNEGVRQGLSASVERAINRMLSLEVGVRYYRETAKAASLSSLQVTPYDGTTARVKLNSALPWDGSSAFVEYEQDIADSSRRVFAVGGNYQVTPNARIYARQEILSSINGLYELNDTQRRNTTVVGIDSAIAQDSSVFSEYRVRDGISAREAEAAMGVRNRWQAAKGVYFNTSFEKIKVLEGIDNLSQDSTALSLGVEYLANPDWKAVGRMEMRWATQSTTTLNTVGFAYKLTDDVTMLTKNVFSKTDNKSDTSGDRIVDRFQLGAAYRDTNTNRFDALTKLEYRYDDNQTNVSSPYLRNVYILSNHVNYHPARAVTLSGQYALKYVQDDFNGIKSNGTAQMLNGRFMYDINERWDAGVNAGVLWSDVSSGKRFLLGAEVGYLLAANLWVSAGYNFAGYRDDDLKDSDTTIKGAYMRFRFKFDEDLLNFNKPAINKSQEPGNATR